MAKRKRRRTNACHSEPCDICDVGTPGIRSYVDQGSGTMPIPGWLVVERCDICDVYADDQQAALALFTVTCYHLVYRGIAFEKSRRPVGVQLQPGQTTPCLWCGEDWAELTPAEPICYTCRRRMIGLPLDDKDDQTFVEHTEHLLRRAQYVRGASRPYQPQHTQGATSFK